MPWRNRGLLAALLLGLASCGVSPEEAVHLKEGQTLSHPTYGVEECTSFGCYEELPFCVELYFEYGRSPPLCVSADICERLQCSEPGYVCRVYEGFPGQIKCVKP
jgi:hypothetical protein